jgi:hypothetical protein
MIKMANKTQLQNEFEAMCFMHEVNESYLLREAVNKFNKGQLPTGDNKILLAKAIWRK